MTSTILKEPMPGALVLLNLCKKITVNFILALTSHKEEGETSSIIEQLLTYTFIYIFL